MERRLEAEKFRTIIESVPDPLLLINTESCIVFVNIQTVKHFGYLRKELIGKNFEILIPERFRRTHFQYVREYFLKPSVRPMGKGLELFALRKDGSEFPVEISLSPMNAQEGMTIIAAIRDITFRKQAEEELNKHRERLEELVLIGAFVHDLGKCSDHFQQMVRHQRHLAQLLRHEACSLYLAWPGQPLGDWLLHAATRGLPRSPRPGSPRGIWPVLRQRTVPGFGCSSSGAPPTRSGPRWTASLRAGSPVKHRKQFHQ